MRNQISTQVDRLITAIIILFVFAVPLILTNLTTEYFETPKLAFLLAVVLVLLVLRSLSWVLQGKVQITRTPIDIPLLLLLTVMVLSSLLNDQSRYISFLGNFPRIHGSTVSWILYAALFFLVTFSLKGKNQVKVLCYALLASATVVALISLLSYLGIYLPLALAHFANFNPAGTSFSATALLVLTFPILLIGLVSQDKFLPKPLTFGLVLLFGLTITLTGNLSSLIGALAGVLLVVFAKPKEFKRRLLMVALPLALTILIYVLSIVPTSNNIFYQKSQNFPREVNLPFNTSWKVAASAFRDFPFLGSGPSTYLFDFTLYKPIEYNSTKLWNVRFDTAFNEFFQVLATTGILGLLALIFFSAMVFSTGWKGLKDQDDPLAFALSVSAIISIILLALHPSTTVSIIATLEVLAMLFTLHKNRSEKIDELTIGIKTSQITDSSLIVGDALPAFLFLPILILVAILLWRGYVIVLADFHHRLALDAAATRGLDTYNQLVMAEQLNPSVDLYRTDLAQTNFALANAIATSKGPTQASPSGSLTDQDKQNIQTLISQSINEGKVAVTLSPLSAQNWEILASIYRQISGVAQNALQFSLDAYGHAIQRDPFNPLLRLSVGGVYYSVKNYDLAIRFFTDSVNLKPDFANGYYNLSVAYRDKGDYQSALAAAQPILNLVDKKSPDYQTASKLISDLQDAAKRATGSAQGTTPPPAAQETGALQQKQLPKVINLPEPSNIATPAAVKK